MIKLNDNYGKLPGSYLFAEVEPGRTLVPGAGLTLPGTGGKITFVDPAYGEDEAVTKQNPGYGKKVQRGQEIHLTVRRAYR